MRERRARDQLADWEFMRQGDRACRLEPLLQAISVLTTSGTSSSVSATICRCSKQPGSGSSRIDGDAGPALAGFDAAQDWTIASCANALRMD